MAGAVPPACAGVVQDRGRSFILACRREDVLGVVGGSGWDTLAQ